MNITLLSQGSALTIYEKVLPELKKKGELDQISLLVADQPYFNSLTKRNPEFLQQDYKFFREWEILAQYPQTNPDLQYVSKLEQKYGDPNLWPALLVDRRIFLGRNTKYVQNYTPRLSYHQMLQFLQTAIPRIEQFLDQNQPDYMVSFNMVTTLEYLFYLVAKQRGIPHGQIKLTKIKNYLTLVDNPLDLVGSLQRASNQTVIPPAIQNEARTYLKDAQAKESTYEGHVILKPPSLTTIISRTTLQKLASSAYYTAIKPFKYPYETQQGTFSGSWQNNIVRPVKAARHHQKLSAQYIKLEQLPDLKYVFFPLHTEPEIALSIYGKHFQNQIEVIRNIALSIPVTWRVIVKDHPRSLGLRSYQYYRKLLEIPNVELVNPYISSYDIIEHAQVITTITSWVGFEAVMSKIPVVTFGECTYNALPSSMVVKNKSYNTLASDIQSAINNYQYNESALLSFIENTIATSVPINMYSEILAKPNRHQTDNADQDQAIKVLAEYIMVHAKQSTQSPAKHETSTQQSAIRA